MKRALLLALALLSTNLYAGNLPSHFSDKVEAALACRSEWSTEYWRNYFRAALGQPIRVWGGAEWFAVDGVQLGGNQIKEVFVNQPDAPTLMVGALVDGPADQVRKNIEASMGMSFAELAGAYPRYLSQTGSVLVGISDPQKKETKWYCARWNLGNRP